MALVRGCHEDKTLTAFSATRDPIIFEGARLKRTQR